MRKYISLLENADEFSTKGHADIKVRANDPRFADNPLCADPEQLDEFDGSSPAGQSSLDRLHKAFQDGGISDQEIKQGIQLTDQGLQKVAAAFGTGPDEIKLLIASLTQHLRDDESDDVEESYDRFVNEDGEDDSAGHPFANAADDHLSAEDDYLGDVTVRASQSGKEKFFQGSQATAIKDRLKAAGNNDAKKQDVLRPLVEDDESEDYAEEIAHDAGSSYNFVWRLHGKTGLGTMQYGVRDGKPWLHLISVRDQDGEEIDADDAMRHALLIQARQFIPDA